MPMMIGDLKSKYILLEGEKFRPYVEWCGTHTTRLELCDTIHKAQVALSKYPADDWDGYMAYIIERYGTDVPG